MVWFLLACGWVQPPEAHFHPAQCALSTADAMFLLRCDALTLAVGEAPGGLDGARVDLAGVRVWSTPPRVDRDGVERYAEVDGAMRVAARVWQTSPARGRWALCAAAAANDPGLCEGLLEAIADGALPDLRPFHGPPGTPPYNPLRWGDLELTLPRGCWLEEDPRGARAVCGLDALFIFPVADALSAELLSATLATGGAPRACMIGGLPALCSLRRAAAEGPAPALIGATQELPDGRVWGVACTWLDEGGALPELCAQLITLPGAPSR